MAEFPSAVLWLISIALYFAAQSLAYGHGAVDQQIQQLSAQIEQTPNNAELYLRRGTLFRLHRQWDKAIADFNYASRLKPDLHKADWYKGRVYYEADQLQQAVQVLDRFIRHKPDHIGARITRARSLVKLEKHIAAITDYDHAIKHNSKPLPELYLERARAQIAAGSEYFESAISGIDEGIARLGPLLILQEEAIAVELQLQRFPEALNRLQTIIDKVPRKEKWLARRAEIHLAAGQTELARQAYRQALDDIAKLPLARQKTRATQGLKAKIESAYLALDNGR